MLSDRCLSCLSELWPNGWMDQDATWYGGRSHPRQHYVRRAHQLRTFRPVSIVAKRSPISATAELLSYVQPDLKDSRSSLTVKCQSATQRRRKWRMRDTGS